jgi:branched-chain amino acid transport system ATP-binding protein
MLLEVSALEVNYGRIPALRGVSLQVAKGEIVTLIGANGAGKTTLLKTISGLRKPAGGGISFGGKPIDAVQPFRRASVGICQVPEGRRVFNAMTVLENLWLGAVSRPASEQKAMKTEIDRVYALFPRLSERSSQLAGTLSGGEQQMLAIGRALMGKPKLLLLDEPSMGLAPIIATQIFAMIREINRQGTTVLLVEQNAMQALRLGHRGYVLETGRIIAGGPCETLLRDEALKDAYLGRERSGVASKETLGEP